jgi:glycosyltransferase involved in cell wall biosynthesis
VTKEFTKQKIDLFNVCVIIPTYNNCKTLQRVIDGVLCYTKNIIIVNDGATDTTLKILKEYPQIQQIHLQKNKGKGNALRVGFAAAQKQGFKYAITIDSDGQHFPEDIPAFITALETSENKNILLIGARNMSQESVPKKSSFGNKFSNFWFWVETGTKLQDTQSGYRLYPLEALANLNFYTSKFEFEIEVIVKAAWSDVIVKNIPIQVLYDETERVSHFRPFKDFTRISILNTWLVTVAFLYIKPRNLFRKVKKKGIKRFFFEDLLESQDSPQKKAFSIALGVFIGISPLWGFHTALVLFFAVVLQLNKVISFAFSNVSLPPFIPFIIFMSLKVGSFVLGEPQPSFANIGENFEMIKSLKTYIVGSFTLAIISAITLGILGYVFLTIFSKKNNAS